MRRARLLIYDGPEEWIEATRRKEYITPERPMVTLTTSIRSIEIDAAELTLFECYDSPTAIGARGRVVPKCD